MGDICDGNDIDRFMRSETGEQHLREIARMLEGRTIRGVGFSNETTCIATTLYLDDDSEFVIFQPSLEVDAIREEFGDVIEKEYEKDYPERRTKEKRK